jgi:hypothetical protein
MLHGRVAEARATKVTLDGLVADTKEFSGNFGVLEKQEKYLSAVSKAAYPGDSVNQDVVDAIVAHEQSEGVKDVERIYAAMKAALKVNKTKENSAKWDQVTAVKNAVADKLALWGMFGPEIDTVCGVRLGCGFLE